MNGDTLFSLHGRVALVTGAARGLGLAMATCLARAGARVLVNGREPARLAPIVDSLRAQGLAAAPLAFDVADEAATEAAFAAIMREHGQLDILVSNVGLRNRRPIGELTRADMRQMLETNLTGAFGLAKVAAELMLPRRHGRLIMVTSVAGPLSRSGDAAYTASKGGVEALTRMLAMDFGPKGIRVNSICPGTIMTENSIAIYSERPGLEEQVTKMYPVGRLGVPLDVAECALYLASDASAFVTGASLVVDGGLTAGRKFELDYT